MVENAKSKYHNVVVKLEELGDAIKKMSDFKFAIRDLIKMY